jgi:hypothetical protein
VSTETFDRIDALRHDLDDVDEEVADWNPGQIGEGEPAGNMLRRTGHSRTSPDDRDAPLVVCSQRANPTLR